MGGGRVHSGKQLLVEGFGGFKAFFRPFRLPLLVYAQQIGGVVTEKVGVDAAGTLHRFRHLFELGQLFVSFLGWPQVGHHILQTAVRIQL